MEKLIRKLNSLSIDIPGTDKDPDSIVSDAIKFALAISGIAIVSMLIYGGIVVMTSAGDPQKLEKGIKTLTYAGVGFVIIMMVMLILNFLLRLLGVDLWQSLNEFV